MQLLVIFTFHKGCQIPELWWPQGPQCFGTLPTIRHASPLPPSGSPPPPSGCPQVPFPPQLAGSARGGFRAPQWPTQVHEDGLPEGPPQTFPSMCSGGSGEAGGGPSRISSMPTACCLLADQTGWQLQQTQVMGAGLG